MQDEIISLDKNQTWKLVERPSGQRVVSCNWVYKIKESIPEVEATRFKARLLAIGFTQREGIDYNEVFSPVVKHSSIRMLLSLTVKENIELEQLDVKTPFLHGELEENIFMAQPVSFIKQGDENKVCYLKKIVIWFKTVTTPMVSKI